jgi:hypothetical protein
MASKVSAGGPDVAFVAEKVVPSGLIGDGPTAADKLAAVEELTGNWATNDYHGCEKTPFCARHLNTKMDHFAKTGSGQTYRKVETEGDLRRLAAAMGASRRPRSDRRLGGPITDPLLLAKALTAKPKGTIGYVYKIWSVNFTTVEKLAAGAQNAFLEPCLYSKRSFHQDRLGTNIGKVKTKR